MRPLWLPGTCTLLLVLAGLAPAADGPPDVRTVVAPQAQVWCGPSTSDGLYPTNLLRQGERVQVVEELPSGWLAIRPPAGSFSWINMRFLTQITKSQTSYVVAYEGSLVPVFIGSNVRPDRPTRFGVRLPRGAIVRGIPGGRTMTDDEGTFLPIDPPEGELRYVRKEDVSGGPGPTRTTVAAAGSAKPAAPALPPPPADGDALWRDAEKAERAGRIADAVRLFRLAGDANLSVNPARSDAAYQRARWLQQANATTNTPGGSYFYPERDARAGSVYPLPTDTGRTNAVRLIGPAGSGAPSGQLVSSQAAPSGFGPQVGCETLSGRLAQGYRNVENQRSYLLLTSGGTPVMHVVAGPGVDLTSHVNRNVELFGTKTYSRELRAYVLTVSQLREVP